ncbi:MAG: ankyrin repeat domain-containing protein [Maricaulaceae bacterium]|jgi:ankyrin repeat protein
MHTRLSIRPLRATLAAGCASIFALAASAQDIDTALADAARDRDFDTVRALLAEGGDVNAFGSDGTPALLWMLRVQDAEAVRMLLSAGADPNLANRYDLLPLFLAVENDDLANVEQLLEAGADPTTLDAAREPMLFTAVRNGSVEVAQALLDAGAEVDARDPAYDQTALMVAAREGQVELARLLIDAGADVNVQTPAGLEPRARLPAENGGSKGEGIVRGGWPEHGMRAAIPGAKTPLLYAVREGSAEIAQMLLDAGAEIERADANGTTPLISALVNDQMDAALVLIEAGADINAVDWYGQTPLWAAVDVRNRDVPGPTRDNEVDREAVLEVIRILLDEGAEVNARVQEYPPERRWIVGLGSLSWVDFTGQTPFLRAALAGDVTVMRLLLDHGADPNIDTFTGTSPLMAAAGVNWVFNQTYDEGPEALLEAVELCWELGNDVNQVNHMGVVAIHGAANRGSDEIVRFLASKGASLTLADNVGRTPMTWAEGVFLATHAPEPKPSTMALIAELLDETGADTSGGE